MDGGELARKSGDEFSVFYWSPLFGCAAGYAQKATQQAVPGGHGLEAMAVVEGWLETSEWERKYD